MPAIRDRLLALAVLALLFSAGPARADSKLVPLPTPKKEGRVSVEAALAARRSVRAYTKDAVTLEEVGQLLWAAQGITGPEGRRTAPSARRRYPLELAVVAQNVAGLKGGAYRYLPASHALEPLADAGGPALLAGATAQTQVANAPAVFIVAAVYERAGPGAREHTFADYEAGLASENLLLEAVALGLGGVVTGGVDMAAVKTAVKFSGGEQVIALIPVGHPGG